MDYFSMSTSMPTLSAFVLQRNRIDCCAFEMLFHAFTESIDEKNLYKGFRLLAVGGSDLHTPTNKDEKSSFYKGANKQSFPLNALYDLQRRIYTDAVVQERKQWNEHRTFVTMVDRDTAHFPTIYITDRGYWSYKNMAHIIENWHKFLI